MWNELKQLLNQTIYKNTITAKLSLILFINLFFIKISFGGYATILIYHKFDEPNSPSTSTPIKDFDAQMKYLKDNQYNVISIEKLVYYLKTKTDIPDKTVVITIDDGYKSTMKAFKILKKYNYPFTLFLYMEGVARFPAYLTKEQLAELKKYPKITFGNHSYKHLRFAKYPKDGDLKKYEKWLREDTIKSGKRFEKLIGYKPKYYAFPYGEYNQIYIKVLKNLGYEALFTQDPCNVGSFINRYIIPRQPVVGHWGTLKHFEKILKVEPLHLTYFKPSIGFLKRNPPVIKYKLAKNERVIKCETYVSELGWLKPKKISDLFINDNLPKLKRWKNRIGVKCWKSNKKQATFFWMIIKKKED